MSLIPHFLSFSQFLFPVYLLLKFYFLTSFLLFLFSLLRTLPIFLSSLENLGVLFFFHYFDLSFVAALLWYRHSVSVWCYHYCCAIFVLGIVYSFISLLFVMNRSFM
ncbi:hypothetical protein E1A91_D05G415500v1 [Gossypium mustelinum]|uniref:Uncharacterized protein n=2 Tax=Gossypium TaxID=3633 RepID=A0A5D2V7E2_GOSMU|nr:hypothetical protein ES332_D05G424100v1 [Gossypium tomentosum]TYI85102.1 hypothetical protein E1A91_D05G415500v1 [Gossypium mustelinum]